MSTVSVSPRNWSTGVKYATGCAVFATALVATAVTVTTASSDSGSTYQAPASVTKTAPLTGPCFRVPMDWNAADGPIPTCTR